MIMLWMLQMARKRFIFALKIVQMERNGLILIVAGLALNQSDLLILIAQSQHYAEIQHNLYLPSAILINVYTWFELWHIQYAWTQIVNLSSQRPTPVSRSLRLSFSLSPETPTRTPLERHIHHSNKWIIEMDLS